MLANGEFNEVSYSCQCRSGFNNTEGFDEELGYEPCFNVNECNATDSEWQDYCGGYATCSDRVPFYKPDELNPDGIAENDTAFPGDQEAPYYCECPMGFERSNLTDQDPYTEYLPHNVEYRLHCQDRDECNGTNREVFCQPAISGGCTNTIGWLVFVPLYIYFKNSNVK